MGQDVVTILLPDILKVKKKKNCTFRMNSDIPTKEQYTTIRNNRIYRNIKNMVDFYKNKFEYTKPDIKK